MVAPFVHLGECLVTTCTRAPPDDDHVLDRRCVFERFVGVPLERNDLAAAIAAVSGDHELGLGVVHPVAQ
jgi:hypothetical protein